MGVHGAAWHLCLEDPPTMPLLRPWKPGRRARFKDRVVLMRLASVFLIGCLLLGCNGSPPPPPAAMTKSADEAIGDDIYNPLSVGSRWEASVKLTRPDGRVLRGTLIREV